MKILTSKNITTVSGGKTERLTVTTKISLNGFSDKCIYFIATIAPKLALTLSEEEEEALEMAFLKNCTMKEVDIFFQRSDEAPYLTVLYTQ